MSDNFPVLGNLTNVRNCDLTMVWKIQSERQLRAVNDVQKHQDIPERKLRGKIRHL